MRWILLAVILSSFHAGATQPPDDPCEVHLLSRPLIGLLELAVREQLVTTDEIRERLRDEGKPEQLSARKTLNTTQLQVTRGLKRAFENVSSAQWPEVKKEVEIWLNRTSEQNVTRQESRKETGAIIRPDVTLDFTGDRKSITKVDLAAAPTGQLWVSYFLGRKYFVYDTSSKTYVLNGEVESFSVKRSVLTDSPDGRPTAHILTHENGEEMLLYRRHTAGEAPVSRKLIAQSGNLNLVASSREAVLIHGKTRHVVENLGRSNTEPLTFEIKDNVKLQRVGDRIFVLRSHPGGLEVIESVNGEWQAFYSDNAPVSPRVPFLFSHANQIYATRTKGSQVWISNLNNPYEARTTVVVKGIPTIFSSSIDVTEFNGEPYILLGGISGSDFDTLVVRPFGQNENDRVQKLNMAGGMATTRWYRSPDNQLLIVTSEQNRLFIKPLPGPTLDFDADIEIFNVRWAQTPNNIYFANSGLSKKLNIYSVFNEAKRP